MDKGELFMQTPKQINISKTMSYALRHKPKQFDLELDEYGISIY